jgi:sphinganine-1-phosphate aldolase
METTRLLIEGINAIPGLRVMSEPAMTVFAFSSEELNVYAIADELHELGWHVERQHLPPSLHLMVTPAHTGKVAEFLADLKKATDKSRGVSNENVSEMAAIYGMLGTLPDRSQAKEFALGYLSQIYRA